MSFAALAPNRWRRPVLLALTLSILSGCASLSPTRCARSAMQSVDFAGMPDKQAHCIASGLIARRCGARYARLAGVGKEWLDLFGGGDASRDDLRADADGRACAARIKAAAATPDDADPTEFRTALTACCVDRWPNNHVSTAPADAIR
ncbi:MAG: hypothetical protein R3F58_15490 [Steroidobacteraceae bacterium]|nr:hypothetical protein [Steroidobacteraceae bacterium]